MSAETTRKLGDGTPANLDFRGSRPVKSNPGAGINGRGTRPVETRDGASSMRRPEVGESIALCPCCGAKVRVETTQRGYPRLSIIRYTKPTVPWAVKGSKIAAEQAILRVCEAHGVPLRELRRETRNPAISAVRKAAAQAARDTGAAATTIGAILHRNMSTINKLAPKGPAR